jgi:hypothetical protein
MINKPIAKINKSNLLRNLGRHASNIVFISYVLVEIQTFNKNNINKPIITDAIIVKIQVSLPPSSINIEE